MDEEFGIYRVSDCGQVLIISLKRFETLRRRDARFATNLEHILGSRSSSPIGELVGCYFTNKKVVCNKPRLEVRPW